MSTVNSMVSYKKVCSARSCSMWAEIHLHAYTGHGIRMAIIIETAHTFTLVQLITKLCQTHCDGTGCSRLAPYIDVFKLTRRCLSINGGCPFPCPPLSIKNQSSICSSILPRCRLIAILGC